MRAVLAPHLRSSLARRRVPHWPEVLGRSRRRVRPLLGGTPWSATLAIALLVCVSHEAATFRAPGGGAPAWTNALPTAVHGVDLALAPSIVIDALGVRFDGRRVVGFEALESPTGDLAPLREALGVYQRNASILHPRDPFPGVVAVFAPAGTPYGRIRRVTEAAALAGSPHVALVVRVPDPLPVEREEFARVVRAATSAESVESAVPAGTR